MKTSKETHTKEEKEIEDYEKESRTYIDKAISLGWKEQSRENREKYLESVKNKIN
ncbi:MAG: hypothetical protein HF314_03255 [Ignavibacteria bacterium]|jgi:hypothetical protein|nr:hypothetical protein [Ignavibacteria bacterium]MCU7502067.1 hypothetical protein [Ignavibacteria bacterium]MCU7515469.1 hypothetical protein [Ignavibacteria bacterium]